MGTLEVDFPCSLSAKPQIFDDSSTHKVPRLSSKIQIDFRHSPTAEPEPPLSALQMSSPFWAAAGTQGLGCPLWWQMWWLE